MRISSVTPIAVTVALAAWAGCSSSSSAPISNGVDGGGTGGKHDSGAHKRDASSGTRHDAREKEEPEGGMEGGDDDSGSVTNGTWTTVALLSAEAAQNAATVTGLWFSSMTNGDVSFDEGIVEHFDAPSHLDVIAANGSAAPGGGGDGYLGFLKTPAGLVAINSYARDSLVLSTDSGKSFTYGKLYGTSSVPSGAKGQIALGGLAAAGLPLLWLGVDSTGLWHAVDYQDGAWSSPTAPGSTATFTLTYHPEGDVTVPSTLPAGDCNWFNGNSYFGGSGVPGQILAVTPDGNTIIYGTGGESGNSPKICRSTDGGKSFVPATLPKPGSAYYPWVLLFTSATAGIAAYGSDGGGSAYVYVTSDGGATWTAGTLPPKSASNVALIHAFASPSGTLWMGGGNPQTTSLLLYKSTDAGKTWTDVSTKLAAVANETTMPLRSRAGFALDDTHIWIGADSGFLAYSSTGGE